LTPVRLELRAELPATLEALERFCEEFREWRAASCPSLEHFSAELLLREALTNYVVHACAEDPSKRIICMLRAKPGRLVISVRDSGPGFDWRAVWDASADLFETHGRGIEMLRIYASAVRFNNSGNSLTLIKRF
jgi:anti-sigma regulatory factor (Ser/Thr protein kinase)